MIVLCLSIITQTCSSPTATKRFYTEETEVYRKTTEYGTTINKVIKIGKKGEIQTSFFYQGGDLSKTPKVITIIPKIYKVK